jgi:hypothetical protein
MEVAMDALINHAHQDIRYTAAMVQIIYLGLSRSTHPREKTTRVGFFIASPAGRPK